MATGQRFTVAHVTHEAVEKIGGIGSVLEGMITSPVYREGVGRTILVGPTGGHHFESPMRRLGERVKVLYSSLDGVDTQGLGRKFHPVERAFGTPIAYGIREYEVEGRRGETEILLFNVSKPATEPLAEFKFRLATEFGIDSRRYEHDWSYEEYCRLAEPAFYALSALLCDDELPCIVVSHEYMGMATALKAVMDGGADFRAVFHAHECATARHLVETNPGHDTAFYNVLHRALAEDKVVADVYGDMSMHMRHALISNAWRLDATMAVGDPTADEMRFLNHEMKSAVVETVYNGLPQFSATLEQDEASRRIIDRWAEQVMGFRPDYLMTHVTRPVISKGLWRDLMVCHHLEPEFARAGKRGLYLLLTCGAAPRSHDDVNRMAREYGWPRRHREGYPDMVGPEVELGRAIEKFNAEHRHIQAVLVNQFGWSHETIGDALDAEATFGDLRRAADVEFGQSVYEPFGIAQLEPLGSGAICVVTNVCGCVWSYRHALQSLGAGPDDYPNVIVADYTRLDEELTMFQLLRMTNEQREAIEHRVAARVATELFKRLPRRRDDQQRLLELGMRAASRMSWDVVIQEQMLPLFRRIVERPRA